MKYLKSIVIVLLGLFLRGAGSGLKSTKSTQSTDQTATAGTGSADEEGEEGADSPLEVSKSGWKAALKRTKQALKDKNLSMMAAGLGYYTTLTFFPAVLGLATLYTALAGPDALKELLDNLALVVPPAIQDLLQTMLTPLTHASQKSLGVAMVISFAAVLWTTSGGVQNLVKATNVAYEAEESRGFVKLRLLSLGLSMVFVIFSAIVLVLLLLQGDALTALGVPSVMANLFPILRWPLLVVLLSVLLAVIYRYAPDRENPKWSWVSWGATAAVIIWMIGTFAFFFYAQHFGNFSKSYGTFASLIILMTWFNLSSLIILVGAQVNKKLEEVTDTDTASRS